MSANEASAVVGTSLWQAEGQEVAWESFCPQNIIYFLRKKGYVKVTEGG